MGSFGTGLLQGLNLAWAQRLKQQQEEEELRMKKEDIKLRQQILKGQEAMQQLTSTKTFLDLQEMLKQREQQNAGQGIIAPAMQDLYGGQPGAAPLPSVAPPPAPGGPPSPPAMPPPTGGMAPPPPMQPQGSPPLPSPAPALGGGAAPKGDVEGALQRYGREQAPAAEVADLTTRIARLDAVETRMKAQLAQQGITPGDASQGKAASQAKGVLDDLKQTRDELTKRRAELVQQQTTARKEATDLRKEQTPKWPEGFEGWFQNTYKMRPQDAWQTDQGKELLGGAQQAFEAKEQAKALVRASTAGAAALERDKDKMLSVQESTDLGLPYGHTKAEAAALGVIPLSADLQKQLFNIGTVDKIVAQLDTQVATLFKGIEAGIGNRLTAAAQKRVQQLNQSPTDVALYESRKEAFLAMMAKTFGESGQLAEGDTRRAKESFPVLFPIPDTEKVAREKMAALKELIAEIKARAKRGTPTGQSAPTGQTAPAGGPDLSKKSTKELFDMLGGR